MTVATKNLPFIENGRRYADCIRCGITWNIAITQKIPSGGYMCPRCEFGKDGKNAKIRTAR